MFRRGLLLAPALLIGAASLAKEVLPPCRTKSRQMTLVKNCYTGDMVKPLEGGAQFFAATEPSTTGASYCYNSLILVQHQPTDGMLKIHVLRDGKDGQIRAFNYSLSPDVVRRIRKDSPAVVLKGLQGECFSPTGNREICKGGILKAIGLKDVNVPMVVAIGKATNGQYTVSHVVYEDAEIQTFKPIELEPVPNHDTTQITQKLLGEIRKKLVSVARTKMSSMHASDMTPQKMAQGSSQFRYCAMALDGFLKDKKLNDPFTSEEKMTLATLTNYMNGDVGPTPRLSRTPASTTRPKR